MTPLTERIARRCRELAAQGWCAPENSNTEMDVDLACAIANIFAREIAPLVEAAEGVLREAGRSVGWIGMYVGDAEFDDLDAALKPWVGVEGEG